MAETRTQAHLVPASDTPDYTKVDAISRTLDSLYFLLRANSHDTNALRGVLRRRPNSQRMPGEGALYISRNTEIQYFCTNLL